MGYRFSLQNVLDWRAEQEDEAKLNMIHAKKELEHQEAYLQKLIRENIQLKEKSVLNNRVDSMRQDDLYKRVLNEKIIQQKLIVEQATHDVERAEEQLVKSYQEKKVMEKLKEKDHQSYIDEVNAIEQKDLDEFATITFSRQTF